ncbi:MAG: homocysteine S-methyltransferase family protein [Gammaproteobacteria bacterium]|nr:homocysteine S-methyltransferase family protein [Gammaproteobacteria bacterium]MDE0366174.1 homocysteine S-methyltransferase family protein [Gammaproteobacteria bacterium]
MTSGNLLERLEEGPVICAEGYVFEMERRGYVQAGPYVPEVVLDCPDAVLELHREFMNAGSDVIEAFTYYAHREKLKLVGREGDLENMNRTALELAKQVAAEGDALVAGNICNTNVYLPGDEASRKESRAMFAEQVGWAMDAGVDFIIGETFSFAGEALLALEVIKDAGAISVITLAVHEALRDDYSVPEACRRLKDAGADVVGLNCIRGPWTMLPLLEELSGAIEGPLAGLPVPYRTTSEAVNFQALTDPGCDCIPDIPFPTALDSLACNRYEIAEFARQAYALGVNYQGVCCGAGPHHIRAMAEALGKNPPASRFSPDMSKHYALGSDASLRQENLEFAREMT